MEIINASEPNHKKQEMDQGEEVLINDKPNCYCLYVTQLVV